MSKLDVDCHHDMVGLVKYIIIMGKLILDNEIILACLTCMCIVYVIDFQEDYPFDDVYCDQGANSMSKNSGKVSMSVLS